ncbi:MAG: protein-L-isoaspartate(D-aspartate) O-methyltransferase [Planctomycetota bacterium]|jgi:protein-L-isoaspartate(D-aspartate) O-methyltransferase
MVRPDELAARMRDERIAMVESQIARRGVNDAAVIAAMRTVPRHEFVPSSLIGSAYEDRPLPIGYDSTISQPYIVAHMTELCGLKGAETVLEVGTGSGYQAAVLAEIVAQVYTIEVVAPLAAAAAKTLRRLAYRNVVVRYGDGADGWPDVGPFDAIVVTAAPGRAVPPALLAQLKDGGRLIAPVGGYEQYLQIFTRRGDRFPRRRGAGVRFVPFREGASKSS